MIELRNVNKTFHSEGVTVEAVKNVNIKIEDGEIFGIIGYSGAGKSTLVRCINLLERPTSGEVLVDEVDLTSLSEKNLRNARKGIGMIFQQFNLFSSRTVFQNIEYPLKHSKLTKAEKKKRVEELLRLVELESKAKVYPSQLSGGQKQRVAIARALASNPKILLCDEATSALDPQTTLSILKLLKQLNKQLGITIIMITHEMQVIKEICDRVAVMENGKVVEAGDVFSVFASPREAITKDFIDTTSNLSKIFSLIEEKADITNIKPGQCIVKFKYLVRSSSEPLISTISRKFNIDANIIFGNIELLDSEPLGGLVSILSGDAEDMEAAMEYLKSKNVGVEVILDARNS
ncbi:methionine ABC transporter ATP-binding protein [Anaerocolumna jejuensis]|uniref:methionine ABC transporter ATP-binding protein n=1 Tax=Anaerocolumna jejuensis TaxID=259063 RepID=UPI003F7BE324